MSPRSSQSDPPLQRLFLDVSALAEEIVSFLRISDIRRFKCTHPSILAWMKDQESNNERFRSFLKWVGDVEVLFLLECSEPLLQKMSKALRKPSRCRIYFTSEVEDDNARFDSLVALYKNNNIPLFGVAADDMESMENDLYNYSSCAVEEALPPASKRLKCVCSSQFCRSPQRELHRPFFVHGNGYCGECVGRDVYLRILFGKEHRIGFNASSWWEVNEEECQNEFTPHEAALANVRRRPNEFSANLWEHSHEIVERFYFIAEGERDPGVQYNPPQLDLEGNPIFEEEELAEG